MLATGVEFSLKYRREIAKFRDCPPDGCARRSARLFRFVHADMNDRRNFTPVLVQDPSRAERESEERCCSGFGLSMYETEQKARKAFAGLRKRFPEIGQTIGTHLAVGDVDHGDGLIAPPSRKGHVDLHEFDNTNVGAKFLQIGPL